MIEFISEWELAGADEMQVVQLLRRCFRTDFGGRSYFQQRPHFRAFWRQQGRIIGHMSVMYRAIRVDGALVTVAGLADVASDPDHRGRGIAQSLLRACIDRLHGTDAAYFLLFGTAPLYGGHGFAPAQNPITYVEMQGAQTGQLRTEIARDLQVLPLRGQDWPTGADVDLMGALF